MEHEEAELSDLDREQWNKIIGSLASLRAMHIISVALKTAAPQHMIDANLPSLWRY